VSIMEPIRYQLKPVGAKQTKDLSHILYLAIVMTKAFTNNVDLDIDERAEASLNSLKMNQGEAAKLFNEASSAFQDKMQASQI
jgi:hypothetical protein